MGCVALLLDKYKKTRSLPSDNAMALDLGLSRQVVSQWRSQDSYPGEEQIARIAEACKEDPGAWLVRVHAERSSGHAHAAWVRLAKQLGVAATLAFATLSTLPAQANPELPHARHYANWWRALVSRLRAVMTSPYWNADHAPTAMLA